MKGTFSRNASDTFDLNMKFDNYTDNDTAIFWETTDAKKKSEYK